MTREGKQIICDRCGAEVFLYKNDTKVLDGGHSHIDIYEKKPDGWTIINDHDLCPGCSAYYKEIFKDFIEKEL